MFGDDDDERRGPKKGEDIAQALNVSLEDLYNGKVQKMAVTRNVICPKCKGTGSKSGAPPEKCKTCDGRGVRLVVRQMGMFIQQSQSVCPDCNGKGETIKDKDKCGECLGKQVIREKKIIEIVVEKGMRENERITFQGESDQAPGMEPGDIIFVIKPKEHAIFKRSGNDLYMEKSIKLIEALTGLEFAFTHLDKRQVIVKSPEHKIIKPGDVLMVPDEGMPVYRRPTSKGNLMIKFNIVFPLPEEITLEKAKMLTSALPTRDVVLPDPNADHVTLTEPRESSHGGRNGESYDEDDDQHQGAGGSRVQCQQQ